MSLSLSLFFSVSFLKSQTTKKTRNPFWGDEGILKFIVARMARTLLTVQLIPAEHAAFATVAVVLPYDVVDRDQSGINFECDVKMSFGVT